ncbi:MAG: hypothetical protein ILO68_08050, partial [Clostridia bacterium]|nr:hypothetical protein [Clostridia bacterium]
VFAEHASEVSGKKKGSSNRRRPSDAYVRKMCACNPDVFPLTNVLSYAYDYGDGWEVEIRLVDEYAGDIGGIPDLPEEQRRLLEKGQPVCVFADGLPVMDDVGGVWGYCEFLETLHDPYADPEEREWARDMGWTGRLKSPKNIL